MDESPRVVGIDEAGRGSFLGPLVVGGFAIRADRVDDLHDLGVRDSKLLSPAARATVYAQLPKLGQMRSLAVGPSSIDRAVRRGQLNELEARTFGLLIRGLRADEAHVDACDTNESRFGRRVAHHAGPGSRVRALHHADRDDPVVGAASIVAKVRRDLAIERLAARLGCDVGSGYPSDARTVEFVRSWVADHPGACPWLRASWATMKRVNRGPPARTLDEYGP